jgi:hypothetical protein
MKMIFRISIAITLFAMLASCSHTPRSYKDSVAMKQIRLDYVKNHPDGEFNQHVKRGEVVKGMSFMGVLASWGLPNVRRISQGNIYEYWIYYTEDKDAGMWTKYELAFKDETLVGWTIDKNMAGSGGTRLLDESRIPVSIDSKREMGTSDTPIKK